MTSKPCEGRSRSRMICGRRRLHTYEQTVNLNPGYTSSVTAAPPRTCRRSRTTTFLAACARYAAVVRPLWPPPITMASYARATMPTSLKARRVGNTPRARRAARGNGGGVISFVGDRKLNQTDCTSGFYSRWGGFHLRDRRNAAARMNKIAKNPSVDSASAGGESAEPTATRNARYPNRPHERRSSWLLPARALRVLAG